MNHVLTKKWIRYFVNSVETFVMFVFKKNEILRLCVDYKYLNKVTEKNPHFLSFITLVLNQLFDFAYFFKLNLKNAYHRIRIRESDEWKTTFRTRYKHFEYMIMSFELTNTSIYINKTLTDIVAVFCVIYFDDILIFFKIESHLWIM